VNPEYMKSAYLRPEQLQDLLQSQLASLPVVAAGPMLAVNPENLGEVADAIIGAYISTLPDTPEKLVAELGLLEEVCAFYANDEDRYLADEGEPFGSIPTEVGLKARAARHRFDRREAAQREDDSDAVV
jgi:hypothetical protein